MRGRRLRASCPGCRKATGLRGLLAPRTDSMAHILVRERRRRLLFLVLLLAASPRAAVAQTPSGVPSYSSSKAAQAVVDAAARAALSGRTIRVAEYQARLHAPISCPVGLRITVPRPVQHSRRSWPTASSTAMGARRHPARCGCKHPAEMRKGAHGSSTYDACGQRRYARLRTTATASRAAILKMPVDSAVTVPVSDLDGVRVATPRARTRSVLAPPRATRRGPALCGGSGERLDADKHHRGHRQPDGDVRHLSPAPLDSKQQRQDVVALVPHVQQILRRRHHGARACVRACSHHVLVGPVCAELPPRAFATPAGHTSERRSGVVHAVPHRIPGTFTLSDPAPLPSPDFPRVHSLARSRSGT